MIAIGLLPTAIAYGIGGETQKLLAIVVIGCLVTSTILTLLILPLIFLLVHELMRKISNRNFLRRIGVVSKLERPNR